MENPRPNVIVIVLDALRARNLGCYGKAGNPTPHLDSLAASGILFERTFCGWNTTDPSLTSILSGRYPRSNGLMDHGDRATPEMMKQFAETGTPLLAELLKNSGYHTAAVDWMGRWFTRGFDDYGYRPRRTPLQKLGSTMALPAVYLRYALNHLPILRCYRPVRRPSWRDLAQGMRDVLSTFAFTYRLAEIQDAGSVTRLATEFLDRSRKDPFFLFLHYWDTHTPYNCPRQFLSRQADLSDPHSLLAARYEGAVRYVDYQLGRLMAKLKERGIWDDTLLVVTADHGDSLTEHDIFFDHHGLYDETTHVPLILHYPKLWHGARRMAPFVQHVDLVPTICEIAGATSPPSGDGTSLIPLIDGAIDQIRDAVFMEEAYVQRKAALRTERYKYIQAKDGTGWCRYCEKVHVGIEELYDLVEDPRELKNLASSNRPLVEELKARLNLQMATLDRKREESRSSGPGRAGSFEVILDPKEEELMRKRLKSLGYLSE